MTVLAVATLLAWPLAAVTAVAPVKTALAPLPGAVKVTVALGTWLPYWSLTKAWSEFMNAVLTVALWPLPLLTTMELGMSALFVSVKLAAFATPLAAAVTW